MSLPCAIPPSHRRTHQHFVCLNSSIQHPHNLSPKMPTRRRVRFLPRTAVQLVPNLDDYSADEYCASWITPDENEASKDHLVETVRRIRGEAEHAFQDDDNFCARGLERLVDSQARADKKKRRQGVIDAVMDEQDRQWSENLPNDDERIAIASTQVTSMSSSMALATAALDSAYVRKNVVPAFRAQCRTLSIDKFDESVSVGISTHQRSSEVTVQQGRESREAI